MELYVLRHGTTDWNKAHKRQGRSDIPLDEEGRKLAEEVGKGMKDIHFDMCFSSPLKRAVETAELVLEGRGIRIITDPRLLEVGFGDFEGKVCVEGFEGYDPATADVLRFDDPDRVCPPGGETLREVQERTRSFNREITEDPANEDKRILISMHGAAGRALMQSAWGDETFWHGCVPKNCTVCIVKLTDGKVTSIQQDVAFYRSAVEDFYR